MGLAVQELVAASPGVEQRGEAVERAGEQSPLGVGQFGRPVPVLDLPERRGDAVVTCGVSRPDDAPARRRAAWCRWSASA